jgi:hypothetical protein
MTVYSLDRDKLQGLANTFATYRPTVGRLVRVTGTKAHVGKVGRVMWHGPNRFDSSGRWCDTNSAFARECRGREGYRVRIQPEDGGEAFFTSADMTMVCIEA